MWDLVTVGAAAGTALLGLASVVVGRALLVRRRSYLFTTAELSDADLTPADLRGSEQRLAAGLSIPTISISREAPPPREELLQYHQHLRDSEYHQHLRDSEYHQHLRDSEHGALSTIRE